MGIENPFRKSPQEESEKNKPIKGDGFTMKKGDPFSQPVGPGIEFRPGESTEKKVKEKEEEDKKEAERTKFFTDANHAEEMLCFMLETHKSYSETFKIKSNGKFDKISRVDGSPVYMGFADTPEELYQIAAEIIKKHPEYHFSFKTDPERKWLKYTVSKDKVDR